MRAEARLRRELARSKESLKQAGQLLANTRRHAATVRSVILSVENRCMAADGPVTRTLDEMTEKELRTIWKACKAIGEQLDA